ncbi:baseplate assembly protein [Pseudomonas helleri]|uniref:baseplate assembly protein n=1 Tax=Pseudomonas helleri TaxID=1608996 RepID=UPI001297CD2C|nr:baseplate J/gp47 family protein [Pseudomonas helleri]MQU22138.1 baseplate assembly protein [Pseudomonas helleri]
MNVDLSLLPVPDVIETIDYEDEYQGILERFRVAMGEQWSAVLESDPVVKLLEEVAYERITMRARINDAARSVLLASARRSDLDQVLALLDAKRLDGESDDDFRQRGRQAPYGYSTAGPLAAYRYHALSASSDVLDAKVDRPEPGVVRITLLSRLGDGVPSAALLATVLAALSADDIRPLTDTLLVVAATVVRYTVKARIYVASGAAPEPLLSAAQTEGKVYTDQQFAIGAPVELSGLYAALHQPGAVRVELLTPLTGIAAQAQRAPLCTGIELEMVTDYV